MWIWSERFSAPVGRSDRPHMGPKKVCEDVSARPFPMSGDADRGAFQPPWGRGPRSRFGKNGGARIEPGLPRNGMWCHRVDVFCPANLPKARDRVDVQCGMRVKALDFQHLLHGHESKNLWMKAEGDLSPAGKVLFSKRYWKEADASVSSENAVFFFFFFRSFSRQAVAFLLDCRGNDLV